MTAAEITVPSYAFHCVQVIIVNLLLTAILPTSVSLAKNTWHIFGFAQLCPTAMTQL